MQNSTSANASEQIVEAATIFAAGILREKLRKNAQTKMNGSFSPSRLDFSLDSSVHCNNPSAHGERL